MADARLGADSQRAVTRNMLAGLTVWAVLVPESLAYASIAGVSPIVGLYAAPAALVLYAIFGSSRHLIVGPSAATAALSAATVGDLVAGGGDFLAMTAALAITVGIVALVAGLLRLGFIASLISAPVLKGFIVGLALTIMVGQLPKLFGVPAGSGNFFEQLADLVGNLGDSSLVTILIGFGSLAIVLAGRRVGPVMPGALIVLVGSVAAIEIFGLSDDIAVVGHIESGLPSLELPDVGFGDVGALVAGAAGIMFVGFAEGLGAAKAYAKNGDEIDPNRELIGLGVANLGAGLSSGMTVNGSLSKSAIGSDAGSTSQLTGIVVAALTIVTILLLTGLFEKVPEAVLGAVVIAALIELVDIPGLGRLYRAYSTRLARFYGFVARTDFIAAFAAMAGVMVFDILPGLAIGIGISFLLLLFRSSRLNVARLGRLPGDAGHWEDVGRHPDAVEDPEVVVLRPEGGIFFANSDQIRHRVLSMLTPETIAVVLDSETIPFVDVTAAEMLEALRERLEARRVRLLLAKDIGQVRDLIIRAGAADLVERTYPTTDEAVRGAHELGRPDSDRC